LIIGSGPERGALASLAAKIGIGEHVIFEESAGDLAPYFQHAQMFLNTARDGADDTLAAAAAAGCVVVSTYGGIAPQIIKPGVNGFLCEATNPACFVTEITRLIRYPIMRERLRANLVLAAEAQKDEAPAEAKVDPMREAWERAVKNFQSLSVQATRG
jgi:glycosyltransferase involved in cell wall biosynthesis